jgi:hypothetical protein
MNIKYHLNLLIFNYFSFVHGLGAVYYLVEKNGSILTTNKNMIENPDPGVVVVMIYENNVNITGYELRSSFHSILN